MRSDCLDHSLLRYVPSWRIMLPLLVGYAAGLVLYLGFVVQLAYCSSLLHELTRLARSDPFGIDEMRRGAYAQYGAPPEGVDEDSWPLPDYDGSDAMQVRPTQSPAQKATQSPAQKATQSPAQWSAHRATERTLLLSPALCPPRRSSSH